MFRMMRYRTLLAALPAAFLLASCSLIGPDGGDELTGSWRWLHSSGGLGGGTVSPDTPGYSERLLHFQPNDRFEMYRADTLFRSGRYYLGRDENGRVIHYRTGAVPEMLPQHIEFSENGDLVLTDLCYDCYVSVYRRAN